MTATPLSPEQLERRWKLWEAMSDAFLDTETRWFLPRIAAAMVHSRYDVRTLDRIWRYEIVPELIANLMVVAGEWQSLIPDGPRITRRANRPPGPLRRLFFRMPGRLVEPHWQALLRLRARLLAAKGERASLVEVWSQFARAYLEPRLERLLSLDGAVQTLRASGLGPTACAATFAEDFRPVYAALLIGRERADESARAGNVSQLIERAFRYNQRP